MNSTAIGDLWTSSFDSRFAPLAAEGACRHSLERARRLPSGGYGAEKSSGLSLGLQRPPGHKRSRIDWTPDVKGLWNLPLGETAGPVTRLTPFDN